jgi:hypothetical protein
MLTLISASKLPLLKDPVTLSPHGVYEMARHTTTPTFKKKAGHSTHSSDQSSEQAGKGACDEWRQTYKFFQLFSRSFDLRDRGRRGRSNRAEMAEGCQC